MFFLGTKRLFNFHIKVISQINSAQYLCNPIDRLYGCRHFASFECEYRGSTWLLKRIEGRACASSELYLRRLLYVVEGRPPPPPGKQTFIFFKRTSLTTHFFSVWINKVFDGSSAATTYGTSSCSPRAGCTGTVGPRHFSAADVLWLFHEKIYSPIVCEVSTYNFADKHFITLLSDGPCLSLA